jgi:hypothetical protein
VQGARACTGLRLAGASAGGAGACWASKQRVRGGARGCGVLESRRPQAPVRGVRERAGAGLAPGEQALERSRLAGGAGTEHERAGRTQAAARGSWRRVQALGGWSRALAQTWASPGRGDCDGVALAAQELKARQ